MKGRDWYDFEWYVRHGHPLNLEHFKERALQSGDWKQASLSSSEFKKMLHEKIGCLDVALAKKDILPFIGDAQALDIWSCDYFHELADRVKFA